MRHTAFVSRREGSALFLVLVIVFIVLSFSAGHFAVVQKGQRQAEFFLTRSDLYQYAESALALSIHDVRYNYSGFSGKIGTERWSVLSDVGHDGVPGTLDDGEQDGIPTPGEPNLKSVPIGPDGLGATVLVSVHPTPYAGVFLLVSTCIGPDSYITIEKVYRVSLASIPAVAAVTVHPETQLVFGDPTKPKELKDAGLARNPANSGLSNGIPPQISTFLIDGFDHTLTGALLDDGPSVHGIATTPGDSPGENKVALLSQIPPDKSSRILGTDGAPSVGEATDAEMAGLFAYFKANATGSLSPGSHANGSINDSPAEEFPVIFVGGDVEFGGTTTGRGALVVEGDLSIKGTFGFQGIVLVKGDVRINGDSGGTQILGTLMADGSNVSIAGSTQILYSSAVLGGLQQAISRSRAYSAIYYNER